jgi:acyl dehydratase
MTVSVNTAADLAGFLGREIGISDWLTIDQSMIDAFADLTGDRQWIHVDVERAKTGMPGGKTIAHGYLVLSLLPRMRVYTIERFSRALNYGLDKLRFTGAVTSGSRIRQSQTIQALEPIEGGYRIVNRCVIQVENVERPAIVADQLLHYFDPA